MAENKTENKTTLKASDLEGADLRHLSVEQVQGISTKQAGKLTPEQVATLTPEQISALSAEQLGALTPEAQARLPQDARNRVTHQKVAEQLNPSQVDLAPGYNADANQNGPLREKVPHYAPTQEPQAGASRYHPPVGQGTPDNRVPPENVTATPVSNEPKPGQPTAAPADKAKDPDPNAISAVATPADVGLPRPELKAGQAPLPEEDPTPSIVPIPPPGPRRVA